jgi:hypothetical protein
LRELAASADRHQRPAAKLHLLLAPEIPKISWERLQRLGGFTPDDDRPNLRWHWMNVRCRREAAVG